VIHLTRHDAKYIAVQAPYSCKDTIKALAPWPDVKWDADSKHWLIRIELFDKLAETLGADFAPLEYDMLAQIPVAVPLRGPQSASDMARARDERVRKAKYAKRKVRVG
jgi:hypothetical protein